MLESRYAAAATGLGIPAPFPEAPLDALGSYSLQAKQPALAVLLLTENRDRYARSSNTHESLGEALEAAGDTTGAAQEFQAAIDLARAELQKTSSVVTRARERAVTSASLAHLRAMKRSRN
jgi:hypothetical protein